MTVSELIEELKKFPGHYTAMLVTSSEGFDQCCGTEVSEFSYIGDVQLETTMGELGCVVKIIAEGE